VDYNRTPPDILCGNFNNDDYPDIARFKGDTLEIFIFTVKGYPSRPQMVKRFDQPIRSLRWGGTIWEAHPPLVVTLTDGGEETFYPRGGVLDPAGEPDKLISPDIPRRVSEADFEIVWESDPRPEGMNRCVVGDLDNDGINELVTFWKESTLSDTAWILIYKCTGDDEYELYTEEIITAEDLAVADRPSVTSFAIADIDQNGQNELVFTYDACYFWEFSAPGVYTSWTSNFIFPRVVKDLAITDVDNDGIMEITSLGCSYIENPPAAYNVWEYAYKMPDPDSTIFFTSLFGSYQQRNDNRFAVGDFDNDGAVDIVSGNFGFGGYDPQDVFYFRYEAGAAVAFSENWLYTGIPLICIVPFVEDFDGDGENELFAVGHSPGHGSAFVWEATGFQTGYVAWLDTTSSPSGPDDACFAVVDYAPSVLQVTAYGGASAWTILSLWMYQNGTYSYAWESPSIDQAVYTNPNSFDPDNDGKMNFIIPESRGNNLVVWEQTSAGIGGDPPLIRPDRCTLYPNYPNPFNGTTVIPFDLSAPSAVRLSIYDIAGRLVYEYAEDHLPPGTYSVDWDARGCPSGVYLIQLEADGATQIRKGVLLK
jgi:hypothetical protein